MADQFKGLATDEIAGRHFPRTKLVFGAEDAATDVTLQDPLPVDLLARPTVARVLPTGPTSTSVTLTASCRRVSMYATEDSWYALNTPATGSSHFIAKGERLDLAVLPDTTIHAVQASVSGLLRLTELG